MGGCCKYRSGGPSSCVKSQNQAVFGASTTTQNVWKHGHNPSILHQIIIPSSSGDAVIRLLPRVQDLQVPSVTPAPSIGPVRVFAATFAGRFQTTERKGATKGTSLSPTVRAHNSCLLNFGPRTTAKQRTFRDSFSQQRLVDKASAALHVGEENKPPNREVDSFVPLIRLMDLV